LDENLVQALQENYKSAPISEQDRVMLDYVVQLTKDATKISRRDHQKLRAAGLMTSHSANHADRLLVQLY
jgi:hypothetical protein